MNSVLIIGAGSIGNHLAFACRQKGWSVDLYDNDPEALQRTRQDIYPTRYGQWDDQIRLLAEESFKQKYDVVIIGTPPDTHLPIALRLARDLSIRFMLIEKPLCGPNLEDLEALRAQLDITGCRALVGYNHIFCENTKIAEEFISNEAVGAPLSLHVRWLEHWGGIFAAHPWLSGPEASYLGHWRRGGGACGEHSHAISLWQHFSNLLGKGDISKVSATMKFIDNETVCYDETAQTLVESAEGLVGSIIQDVVTAPAEKFMRIQFENGFLCWEANADPSHDSVRFGCHGKPEEVRLVKKSRPDDFRGQIDHIDGLLSGKINAESSANALGRGVSVMQVISAAYDSAINGTAVQVQRSL